MDLVKLELEAIGRIGANLLIIENTPVWPDKKLFNFDSPIIKSYEPAKWYVESAMDLSNNIAAEKLVKWFRKLGYRTLNINDVYCQRGICSRYSRGEWLFFDDNYLSIYGANLSILSIEKIVSQY